jgi:hypothetical protein
MFYRVGYQHSRKNCFPEFGCNDARWIFMEQFCSRTCTRITITLLFIESLQSKGTSSIAKLLTIADPEKKIPIIFEMLFPDEWLEAKADGDAEGRTNREVQWVVSGSSSPAQILN